MRAMSLRGPCAVEENPLEMVDLPIPEPGVGEVLLQVEVCGICRTDLHVVEGDLASVAPHIVPGHEVVGHVVKNGPESSRFETGARVGAAWVGDAADSPPAKLRSAVLFAPAGELVPPALRALDRGGTLAIAGIYLSAIPAINYDRELFLERTLCSVTANTRKDGEELLRLAADIPISTHTEVFALEEANLALRKLKQDGLNGAGVLQIMH